MTTAIQPLVSTRTIIGAELIFTFSAGTTTSDFNKIVRKVMKHCDTSYYPAVPIFFTSRSTVRAIITYETSSKRTDKMIDEINPRLTRMIDSHDDVATYAWSH